MLPIKRTKLAKLKKSAVGNFEKKKKYSFKHKQREHHKQHRKTETLSQNDESRLLKYKANQRITVKRGIFPHAIRTDVVKKQNFCSKFPKPDLGKIITNNAGIRMNFIPRMNNNRTNVNADESNDNNRNDLLFSNGRLPYLEYDNMTPFQKRKVTPLQKTSSRKSFNSTEIFTEGHATKNSAGADDDHLIDTCVMLQINKTRLVVIPSSNLISYTPRYNVETEDIKIKKLTLKQHISRIEWYEKDEAQAHVLYREHSQAIKKTMIIESASYFSCADTMQEIQQKLWNLRDLRDEDLSQSRRTSDRTAVSALEGDAILPNPKLNKIVDSPMIVDDVDTVNYFTPPQNYISEHTNAKLTPVGQTREQFLNNQNPKVGFKFCSPSACKNSQNNKLPRKEEVVLRTRKTMEKLAHEKNALCFQMPKHDPLEAFYSANYHQANILPKMPIVPDTIDQNSALGPLEYLDYVSRKRGNTETMFPDETDFKPTIKKPTTCEFPRFKNYHDENTLPGPVPRQKYSELPETYGLRNYESNLFPDEFYLLETRKVPRCHEVPKNYSPDVKHGRSNPFALHQPNLFPYESMVPKKENQDFNNYFRPGLTSVKSPKLLYSARYVH